MNTFYKKLTVLVLPIAFQNFMLSLVSATDAVMLGKLSQNMLSAVSLASQIAFVHSLFLTALTIGMTILVAQYWGKGDRVAVEKITAHVMIISGSISAVFSVVSTVFPQVLMAIFTSDGTLIQFGSLYLQIAGVSYLLSGISQIYLCVMKNNGRAVKSMIISSVSVILNILFNALLIFGLAGFPAMGIAGAASATVLCRCIELLWAFAESLGKDRIRLQFAYIFRNEKKLTTGFRKYTAPVLANELAWGCGFTMYSVIMGHLGSDAVAANSLTNIIKNLIVCFCIGIGNGGGIIIGNELGHDDLALARKDGDTLLRLSVIGGIITGVILLAVSPLIPRITALSPQSEIYFKKMCILCACYLVGKSVNSTLVGGIFCAGGDSKFGLICDSITMWLVTVPLGCITAFILHWSVVAVFAVINMDEVIKLPAVLIHYKKYNWIRNLIQKDSDE
ncbi:MAG: MATE family efflux transporter [Treponema sp.]|nr:MATE family efflux transporter [Treponema sp.]